MVDNAVDIRILSKDEEEKSWFQKILYTYTCMHTHKT